MLLMLSLDQQEGKPHVQPRASHRPDQHHHFWKPLQMMTVRTTPVRDMSTPIKDVRRPTRRGVEAHKRNAAKGNAVLNTAHAFRKGSRDPILPSLHCFNVKKAMHEIMPQPTAYQPRSYTSAGSTSSGQRLNERMPRAKYSVENRQASARTHVLERHTAGPMELPDACNFCPIWIRKSVPGAIMTQTQLSRFFRVAVSAEAANAYSPKMPKHKTCVQWNQAATVARQAMPPRLQFSR